jgi:hypothetical protein
VGFHCGRARELKRGWKYPFTSPILPMRTKPSKPNHVLILLQLNSNISFGENRHSNHSNHNWPRIYSEFISKISVLPKRPKVWMALNQSNQYC